MAVTVKITEKGTAKLRADIAHIRGGFEKAIGRAAARVASQGKTMISKELRQTINIKAKDINSALKTGRSNRGSSIKLAKQVRLPLKYFGARQTAKGVSYKIDKAKGRSFVAGAFGPNIPRLGRQVFKRIGTSRLPIIALFGISPWGVFVRKAMYKPTHQKLTTAFEKRLRHEIDFLIQQKKNKSG